jgi:hypothetical protein
MENTRLTIAVGMAILLHRGVEITVWQEERLALTALSSRSTAGPYAAGLEPGCSLLPHGMFALE